MSWTKSSNARVKKFKRHRRSPIRRNRDNLIRPKAATIADMVRGTAVDMEAATVKVADTDHSWRGYSTDGTCPRIRGVLVGEGHSTAVEALSGAEQTTETEMGKHRRDGRGSHDSYGRDEFPDRWSANSDDYATSTTPRMLRPISWIVAIVGLAVWSLLAGIGYTMADSILGWIAANTGLLVDGGKGLATATGVGKEVGSAVDTLNVGGFSGQAIALVRVVLKPAIIVLWAIGALAVIAAPVILPRIGRLLGRRRH